MHTGSNAKLVKTANLLREAIPKMSQLEIPLTPENYHTWYEYTNGNHKELKNAIDELLASGSKFTSKINSELYHKHIYQTPEESLKTCQQDVKQLIGTLIEKISSLASNTQNFSSSLEKHNDVLKSDPDIQTITALITNMMVETDSVIESNRSMENMLKSMSEEVETLRGNLQALNIEASTDQLTDVPNRRAFDNRLDELFDCYHDEEQVFSLLMIDIDYFKKFNDTYGHAVGDKVLKYVASIMTGGVKGDDMVARFGGEEFAVLLPNTSYKDAIAVADHVRTKISNNHLVDSHNEGRSLGNVTVSIGVSMCSETDDADSIIERADKALYLAKEKGRDRVIGEQAL